MAFLFGRNKQRSAQDLVRSVKDLLQKLVKEEGQVPKVLSFATPRLKRS